MLSYQHIYHAGCLADVHKHSILSVLLSYFIEKDNAITYMETHSGRGLYNLNSPEAQKTKEAKEGIEVVLRETIFPESHPYIKTIAYIKKRYGQEIYPGSPALAKYLLRPKDQIHLIELHPQEIAHLRKNITGPNVHIHYQDGYPGALKLSPPTPRRGIIFIDPSYEIKKEYPNMVAFIEKLQSKWPEAMIALWYPMLKANHHEEMRDRILKFSFKNTLLNEIQFSNPATSKGLYGSGLLLINCPQEAKDKINKYEALLGPFTYPKPSLIP